MPKEVKLLPATPFSNGTEYEFFLMNFCGRCKKHKENEDGFCAFVEQGGCPIENACEDARLDISKFPNDKIVKVEVDGKVKYWTVCTEFESDDAELMAAHSKMLGKEEEI